jgi:hypothetical protein
MRALSAEPLGNPPKDLEAQEEKMRAFLDDELGENAQVPVDGYIIFTNPRTQVTVDGIQQPVLVLSESPDALKNAIRKDKRAAQLPKNLYDQLVALFEKEAEEKQNQPQSLLQFWRR